MTWMNLNGIMLSEKEPDSKGHMLYDTIYMKFWKGKSIRLENNQWLTVVSAWPLTGSARKFPGGDGSVL